jgi:hypothetical protein
VPPVRFVNMIHLPFRGVLFPSAMTVPARTISPRSLENVRPGGQAGNRARTARSNGKTPGTSGENAGDASGNHPTPGKDSTR